jgi:hypothetical protein
MDATGSILPGLRPANVVRNVFIKPNVNPRICIFAEVAEGFAFLQTFYFSFGLQALDFGAFALSFNPAGEINLHRGNRAGVRGIGFDGSLAFLIAKVGPPGGARFGRRVGRAWAGQQLRPQFAG